VEGPLVDAIRNWRSSICYDGAFMDARFQSEGDGPRVGDDSRFFSSGISDLRLAPDAFRSFALLSSTSLAQNISKMKQAEPGGAPNAHPRHASCLSLRSGTSRATGERG